MRHRVMGATVLGLALILSLGVAILGGQSSITAASQTSAADVGASCGMGLAGDQPTSCGMDTGADQAGIESCSSISCEDTDPEASCTDCANGDPAECETCPAETADTCACGGDPESCETCAAKDTCACGGDPESCETCAAKAAADEGVNAGCADCSNTDPAECAKCIAASGGEQSDAKATD